MRSELVIIVTFHKRACRHSMYLGCKECQDSRIVLLRSLIDLIAQPDRSTPLGRRRPRPDRRPIRCCPDRQREISTTRLSSISGTFRRASAGTDGQGLVEDVTTSAFLSISASIQFPKSQTYLWHRSLFHLSGFHTGKGKAASGAVRHTDLAGHGPISVARAVECPRAAIRKASNVGRGGDDGNGDGGVGRGAGRRDGGIGK